MLQNDEALYYGKPHLRYITPKTLVIIGVVSIYVKVIILFFCWLQISSGVAPLSRIALGFTPNYRSLFCSLRYIGYIPTQPQ